MKIERPRLGGGVFLSVVRRRPSWWQIFSGYPVSRPASPAASDRRARNNLSQRETKNGIRVGFAVCDISFFRVRWKMKSAGEGGAGLWQIRFWEWSENEIRRGVAGLWHIIFQSEVKNEICQGWVYHKLFVQSETKNEIGTLFKIARALN